MNESDIRQGLEQDARLVVERIPENMSKENVKAIGKKLGSYIRSIDMRQSEVAKAIGVSGTAISHFIAGKYQGDVEELTKKVVHFINTVALQRKTMKRSPKYVETSTAKIIFRMMRMVEGMSLSDEARIGVVIGDSGGGKSKCLKAYAADHKNSLYVEIDDDSGSKEILQEIAKGLIERKKMKINLDGTKADLKQRLIDKLCNRQMTIIIDEASDVNVRQLNMLRQVITIRCKCPLVLAGNNHLLHTLNKDPGRYGNESLDQFRSRMIGMVNLDDLTDARDDNGRHLLHTEDDIRQIYQQLGIRLTTDAVVMLQKICRIPQTGRLRTCSTIIETIVASPVVANNNVVCAEDIYKAARFLGLLDINRLPLLKDVKAEAAEIERRQMANIA